MDTRREVLSDREQAVQFLIDVGPHGFEMLLDGFYRICVQSLLQLSALSRQLSGIDKRQIDQSRTFELTADS